jgi:hypothetical protein
MVLAELTKRNEGVNGLEATQKATEKDLEVFLKSKAAISRPVSRVLVGVMWQGWNMGMRFSTVLALTGIACIFGVSKPGIAGVSFSDIAATGLGNLTLLDTATLDDPTRPGHINGLTFTDTTYLAFSSRVRVSGLGFNAESEFSD